jgi:aspartate/tyrosine/aromatic aminotransferase
MLEDLNSAEENTVVILHAAAHNPTGKIITAHSRKKSSLTKPNLT